MELQLHRQLGRVGRILRRPVPSRGAENLRMILHQHAVLQDGDERGAFRLAALIETRGLENDVVGLPLARLAAGVHQRRALLVNRGRLAVEIRLILVRIEDLDFVDAHHEHAAVAPFLAVAHDFLGRGPFDVELAIAEGPLGVNVVLGGNRIAVLDLPVLAVDPLREVVAVKQHDGIAGRPARRARIDNLWLRPRNSADVLAGAEDANERKDKDRRDQGGRPAGDQVSHGSLLLA